MTVALRIGRLNIDHPGSRERSQGKQSSASLQVLTEKGTMRLVPLDEDALVRLLAEAAKALQIIRDSNGATR